MMVAMEFGCAVPPAVILTKPDVFRGRRMGVTVTGGNVDLDALPWIRG